MKSMPSPDPVRRRWLAALPLLVTGLYLNPGLARGEAAGVHQASRPLMGTRLDITVQCTDALAAGRAMDAAFAEMARLAGLMSRYPDSRGTSAVHALHEAAGRRPLPMAPEMMQVLNMAKAMSQRSAGAFDITVGVFDAWSFDPDQERIPSAAEIAREIPLVNHRDLIVDDKLASAYLRRSGMRIDLGGIAKLPILRAGLSVLQGHGLRSAMLNGGGDVLVSGQLQGRDWRVGVRDPRDPSRLLGVVGLSEGFVAASGDYERCFVRHGRRYHHILDPKTGQPTQGPHGVTLVSPSLEAINGLGAAIMVAGARSGRELLAPLAGVDALIVESDRRLWLSPGMARRLQA
nr:FAD:protein FMN transferase [uncultured Roseateles sp.]